MVAPLDPRGREVEMHYLRSDDICRITGLSRSTIDRYERDGAFPARRLLGPRAVGWLKDEVMEWMAARPTCHRPTRTDQRLSTAPQEQVDNSRCLRGRRPVKRCETERNVDDDE
ncbi:helix-turn-helix transcriptional regulator [Gemmatimonadota bacterium]